MDDPADTLGEGRPVHVLSADHIDVAVILKWPPYAHHAGGCNTAVTPLIGAASVSGQRTSPRWNATPRSRSHRVSSSGSASTRMLSPRLGPGDWSPGWPGLE